MTTKSHIVKMIYDPACGTGGMLSSAEQFIREYNSEAKPLLYGQDWNDEAYAICKADMLIKGEDADNVKIGDTFSDDGFPDQTFDYMLATLRDETDQKLYKDRKSFLKDLKRKEYFKREVKPHVPCAWIDHSKTKVGYEIPLTRHFYRYKPPRPLHEIEADLKDFEQKIVRMLGEVVS